MAAIHRDAYGVPQVVADDVLDLARGQGEAVAQDRPGQLDGLRRAIDDPFARRTGVADLARRAHARLQPETAAFVAAYVDGVNAVLDRPWEPWTPLAVFRVHHLLFGNLTTKLWTTRARAVLGDDAGLLSREGPLSSGSNAWAVGGRRTASGLPLVGGDPHRALESPSLYVQVRLTCDELDVTGFAFVGVPGVQHFAHAGDVAWAITNGMGNYEDVYAEQLRRTPDGLEALGPDGWEPVEVDGDLVRTRRGPVFADGLSLRLPCDVLEDLGFDTFLPLLRSRTAADVMSALDGWVEPVNNVVAADRGGDVRYRLAGRVPQRAEANRLGVVPASDPAYSWRGWLDLPAHPVPADGQVVTANDRRGPESAAIGTDFAPPHRAVRIHALLAGRTGLTAADFAAIHRDTLLLSVPVFQDLLRDLPAGPVRDAILAWDGHMDADSYGAAAFAAWRSALTRRVAAEPVLAPLAEPIVDDPVLTPWLTVTGHVALALEALVEARTPFGIDLVALATAALDDAAGHPATWGETHVVVPVGAPVPPLPLSGDIDCVHCTSSQPGVTDACARGSVARYVWDLAGGGGWIVPLGAAEHGPHRIDQLSPWAAGDLLPIVR